MMTRTTFVMLRKDLFHEQLPVVGSDLRDSCHKHLQHRRHLNPSGRCFLYMDSCRLLGLLKKKNVLSYSLISGLNGAY